MQSSKFRWSKVYESSEEELTAFLESRNIQAERLDIEAGSDPVEHASDQTVTLWCAEGSLTVRADDTTIPLQPGDALRLTGPTAYVLQPGIAGYVCYVSK